MLGVAWQCVRRQPGRHVALATAVALPVLLVLLTSALYLGLLEALVEYPRTLGGDVVVAEAGGSPMFMRSASRLPEDAVRAVRSVPGVASVDELYGRLVWVESKGRKALVFLVGLFPEDRFAAPVRIVAGKDRPELDEIVVDRVLAHDFGLALRAPIRIGGARFKVAGIADGGNSMLGTFAFMHHNALALAGTFTPSHLVVHATPGTDPAALARRLRKLPRLQAYTREVFLAEGAALARQFYRPVLGVIVVVSALVGGTILALTLWAATIEQREEYGLLKALGLSRAQVYGIAVWQALLATTLGAAAGIAAGYGLAGALGRAVPRFVASAPWWLAAGLAGGALLVGLVASLAPVRVLMRLEPGQLFRV